MAQLSRQKFDIFIMNWYVDGLHGGCSAAIYTGLKDTYKLKGTNAKAKANASQGVGQMIEIATGSKFTINKKDRHKVDDANGKKYLYDIIKIKKETSNPLSHWYISTYGKKPIS